MRINIDDDLVLTIDDGLIALKSRLADSDAIAIDPDSIYSLLDALQYAARYIDIRNSTNISDEDDERINL